MDQKNWDVQQVISLNSFINLIKAIKSEFRLANFPLDVVKALPPEFETGVYFGWANIDNGDVYKSVLSIGWNPFYNNKEKSIVRIYHFIFKSNCLQTFNGKIDVK